MSYCEFVKDLNRHLGGYIIAFDNKKDPPRGCVLYMANRKRTIFVPATIISKQRQVAISALQAQVRNGRWDASHLVMTYDAGVLTFQAENLATTA